MYMYQQGEAAAAAWPPVEWVAGVQAGAAVRPPRPPPAPPRTTADAVAA